MLYGQEMLQHRDDRKMNRWLAQLSIAYRLYAFHGHRATLCRAQRPLVECATFSSHFAGFRGRASRTDTLRGKRGIFCLRFDEKKRNSGA